MRFWKKRKPEQTEQKSPTTYPEYPDVPPLMGYVARPLPPRHKEPEPDDVGDAPRENEHNEHGEEGTSRAAQAVSAGMEHLNSPRTAGSFDPSKASPSTLIPLQSVQIATPCRADWSKMEGDDKSRFCQTCQKSVYNLSAMTTPEAQALLAEKNGDLCARLYRREDGTVITSDCTVGKTAPRRALWGAGLAAIAAALLSGCGSNSARSASASGLDSMRNVPVLGALINLLSPQPPALMGDIAMTPQVMGKVACPVPTATPKPSQKPTPAPTAEPHAEPDMGAVAYPVMGRIAVPRPTATPKPSGEPEMGETAISGS